VIGSHAPGHGVNLVPYRRVNFFRRILREILMPHEDSKMTRLGTSLIAIMLVSATAAHAADLNWNSSPSTMYSSTPAASWAGFYAGANLGHGWGRVTEEDRTGGGTIENNSNGWQAGVQAGYNADMGGFVLGGEADLQWANIAYSRDLPGGSTWKTGVDVYGTVRARAGANLGQVMPYVTAGIAVGRGSASHQDTSPSPITTSQSNTHFGWTAGAGLEAMISDNISIKGEYLYVDLGKQNYTVGGMNNDITQRFSTGRAGINYKF
jgi:outer membrane immunogenic protein